MPGNSIHARSTRAVRIRRAICRVLARLSSPAWRGILIAALMPVAVRLACLPWMPEPLPRVHDEFSYLLAADTFAQGRLTNPAHPLWEFFETIHVLQKPTYMSMYPVMQGLVLALGKVVFGHPWAGVLLSVAAMCGMACWMLRAWLPPAWALLGALLMGLQFATQHYWIDSYWGGAVAATAGCLVLGAWGRLRRARRISARCVFLGIALGVGVGILANSRPWEGLLLCLTVGVAFLGWMIRSTAGTLTERFTRVAAPCAAVLSLTAAFMMYNNWRVTGDASKLPYVLNRETYAVAPVFVWERARPQPGYRHKVLEEFFTEWEPAFQGAHTLTTFSGWVLPSLLKLQQVGNLAGGLLFVAPPVLFLIPLCRAPGTRFALIAIAVFCLGLLLQRYALPHYLAPILGALTIVKIAALRRLFHLRIAGRRAGLVAAPLLILAGAIIAWMNPGITVPGCLQPQRQVLTERLENSGQRHLVIVRYSMDHNVHCEWVYNDADVDQARIVWARDMSSDKNRRLLEYYRGRHVWLLEADSQPPRLTPLTEPGAAAGPRGLAGGGAMSGVPQQAGSAQELLAARGRGALDGDSHPGHDLTY
jgi:hypothetical protein